MKKNVTFVLLIIIASCCFCYENVIKKNIDSDLFVKAVYSLTEQGTPSINIIFENSSETSAKSIHLSDISFKALEQVSYPSFRRQDSPDELRALKFEIKPKQILVLSLATIPAKLITPDFCAVLNLSIAYMNKKDLYEFEFLVNQTDIKKGITTSSTGVVSDTFVLITILTATTIFIVATLLLTLLNK
jgi:hypothetical protein